MRPGQPKNLPDNQKYRCSCVTDNHKSQAPFNMYIFQKFREEEKEDLEKNREKERKIKESGEIVHVHIVQ